MRCKACNEELSDFEATRKSISTWEYIELCNGCFRAVSAEVPALNRNDLMTLSDADSLEAVDNFQQDIDFDEL